MAQAKPNLSEGVWATAPATSDTPDSGKVAAGWTVETPPAEWQNWWQNRSDEFMFHMNDYGMPQWDANTTYPLNALTMSAGIMYKSLQAGNTGQIPASQPTFWQPTLGASPTSALNNDFLRKDDNLNSVASKSTSFNNIKQAATTSSTGVVEKAVASEMTDGTADKFPDAAAILAWRNPISVWSGSDNIVTPAEILAFSGHVVGNGNYYVRVSTLVWYTVSIVDGVGKFYHTSYVSVGGSSILQSQGVQFGGTSFQSFDVEANLAANTVTTSPRPVLEILFAPL